jgi:hypothetical protein
MSFEETLNFKRFVLKEDNSVLKKSAASIAEKIQSMKNLAATGIIELKDDLEDVFNTCQSMLNGKWLKQQQQYLIPIQTVAYNLRLLADGDDEAKEQDVAAVLQSCYDQIDGEILNKIDAPINNLAVPKKDQTVTKPDKNQTGGTESGKNKGPTSPQADKTSVPPLGQPTDEARPAS